MEGSACGLMYGTVQSFFCRRWGKHQKLMCIFDNCICLACIVVILCVYVLYLMCICCTMCVLLFSL